MLHPNWWVTWILCVFHSEKVEATKVVKVIQKGIKLNSRKWLAIGCPFFLGFPYSFDQFYHGIYILVPGILYVILYALVKSWKVSFFVFCGARNTCDKVDRNTSSAYAYDFVILLYSWHVRDLFVWQAFILLLLWQVRLCLLKEAITVSPVPTWNGVFGCYSS